MLRKESYKDKPKSEIQKIVRMSIRNYISDICTKGGKSTAVLSDRSLNEYDSHNIEYHIPFCRNLHNTELDSSHRPNFPFSNFPTPEQTSDVNGLIRAILKWGQNKDGETQLFLKEVVNPSDMVLDKWNQLLDNIGSVDSKTGKIQRRSGYNVFKNTGQIPSTVFEQTLSISASKCRRIIKSLAKYLKKEGYILPLKFT